MPYWPLVLLGVVAGGFALWRLKRRKHLWMTPLNLADTVTISSNGTSPTQSEKATFSAD